MTNTTTPLTREQALEKALREVLSNPSDWVGDATDTDDGYLLTPRQHAERRARAALALPPTDLSGAMKYTGPGDVWPMLEDEAFVEPDEDESLLRSAIRSYSYAIDAFHGGGKTKALAAELKQAWATLDGAITTQELKP